MNTQIVMWEIIVFLGSNDAKFKDTKLEFLFCPFTFSATKQRLIALSEQVRNLKGKIKETEY